MYLKDFFADLKKIFLLIPYYELKFILKLIFAWATSIRISAKESCRIYGEKKNEIILTWLNKRFDYLVPQTIAPPCKSDEVERIFVFWYQGIDVNVPDVVRICINSIKQNANGREVVIVTKDNMKKWANIPEYIYRQVETGAITITHLSDILRICLLYQHGGYWIDATVFLTEPIDNAKFNPYFGSIKIHDKHTGTISKYRWTTFFLHSVKGCITMKTFRDVLFEYFKAYRGRIIDYLLIDFTFEMLYRKCSEFKELVDNVPYTNENLYDMVIHLNDTIPLNEYLNSFRDTYIFKLTWRKPFAKEIGGKSTIFGQLLYKIGN